MLVSVKDVEGEDDDVDAIYGSIGCCLDLPFGYLISFVVYFF